GEHTVFPQHDVFEIVVSDDAHRDDVARTTKLSRRRHNASSSTGEGFERLGPACPDAERKAPVDDPARHRRTLASQPDESDPCHAATSSTLEDEILTKCSVRPVEGSP